MSIATLESVGQLSSVYGEIRYQNQYQDASSLSTLYRFSRSNPEMTIGTSGFVLSPYILAFDVRSSLDLNYTNSRFAGLASSYRQIIWGLYDLNVDALQHFPVRVSVSARDQKTTSTRGIYLSSVGLTDYRQRQQRIELTTIGATYLPAISLAYLQRRNWSDLPSNRFDQNERELTLTLSQSTSSAAVGLTGSMSDNEEHYTGLRQKYFRVRLNGNAEFSPQHRVDATSEYMNYARIAIISANGYYNGRLYDRLRLRTDFLGRNLRSSASASTTFSIGQSVQYIQNENFNYTLSVNDQIIHDRSRGTVPGEDRQTIRTMGTGTVQHLRLIQAIRMTNGISLGFTREDSRFAQRAYSAGTSNSFQTSIRGYLLSINQTLSFNRMSGYLGRDEIDNILNMMMSTVLLYGVNSQTSVEYRIDRRFRTSDAEYRFQTFQLRQNFWTSAYWMIPLTLTMEGTLNWVQSDITGRSYGILTTVQSSYFFVPNVSMNYRLHRTYDLYYRHPYLEQTLELSYHWRALSFQMRAQEFRFVDVRHDIWFTVSRPFNFGI